MSLDCRNSFHGLARIRLHNVFYRSLSIPEYFKSQNAAERKGAQQLVRRYEIEGCQRTNHHNHVDVVVTEAALRRHSDLLPLHCPLSADGIPFLDAQVECLHGLHRLLAALEFFSDEGDLWWIARIFTEDISQADRSLIAEQYGNESHRLDGIIFRYIRLYRRDGNMKAESRWWARLTSSKRKDLGQLLKDTRYTEAFDNLLKFPGLWYTVKLGCLHRLLTMKCDEELLRYLAHIASIWNAILSDVPHVEDLVDEATVSCLETLAPSHSSDDMLRIRGMMEERKIFARLQSSRDRDQVLQNLSTIEVVVPSLYTFFESLKYLEPCAGIIRRVAPMKGHASIQQALWSSFSRPREFMVQYSEDDIRHETTIPEALERNAAYHQLWLFAMRHFPLMVNATTRKDKKRAKPVAIEPDPRVWQRFGELCCRLGFLTTMAREWRDSDGNAGVAKQLARHIDHNSKVVERIATLLSMEPTKESVLQSHMPSIQLESLTKERRCGRPFASDHAQDASALFLPSMNAPRTAIDDHVSTFFCKKDMFRGFFGTMLAGIEFTAKSSEATQSNVRHRKHSPSLDRFDHRSIAAGQAQETPENLPNNNRNLVANAEELQRRLEVTRCELQDARQQAFQMNSNSIVERDALTRQLQAREVEVQELRVELDSKLQLIAELERRLQPTMRSPRGPNESGMMCSNDLHRSSSSYSSPSPKLTDQELVPRECLRIDLQDRRQIEAAYAHESLILAIQGRDYAVRISREQAKVIMKTLISQARNLKCFLAPYRTLPEGFKIVSESHYDSLAKLDHFMGMWQATGALKVQLGRGTGWTSSVNTRRAGMIARLPPDPLDQGDTTTFLSRKRARPEELTAEESENRPRQIRRVEGSAR